MDENGKLLQIGQRIRTVRKYKRMTQGDLAHLADMKPSNISEIENGKTQMQLLTFLRILEALQVSADEILRANVPCVKNIYQKEYIEVLQDCSPSELDAITKIVIELKSTLRSEPKK